VCLNSHNSWTLISLHPLRDTFTGEIAISDVLADLAKHGIISGEEYLGDVELGAEPGGGIGTGAINKFDVEWK